MKSFSLPTFKRVGVSCSANRQSPPMCPVSVEEPTYPVLVAEVTEPTEPAQPPPPSARVRPFQAPSIPPVPPSRLLRGKPTRIVTRCRSPAS